MLISLKQRASEQVVGQLWQACQTNNWGEMLQTLLKFILECIQTKSCYSYDNNW